VLDVEDDADGPLIVTVESDQAKTGCPSCGVIAASHGHRPGMLHDAPCLKRITMARWVKRTWRCWEPVCPIGCSGQAHDIARRAVLTVTPYCGPTDALARDDTTVSALARRLDWYTCWNAIEIEAKAAPATRCDWAVSQPSVDEHVWRHSKVGVDRAVTIIVDLSRDQAGCLHADCSMPSWAAPENSKDQPEILLRVPSDLTVKAAHHNSSRPDQPTKLDVEV
jgi:transposase